MRLADWRQEEGLTQVELAGELGIHVQYLSQIERGVRPAGGKLALKIHRRSGHRVSLASLIEAKADEKRVAA